MKGAVTFSEKTFSLEGKGFTYKLAGEALNPPKTFAFGKKGTPKPEGTLVFQSALPTIGPRILPKEGELRNVVFVEFPDDISAPELINFKTGYRLVREAPDEKGEYAIKVYAPHSKDSISRARFNKEDRLVSMDAFGKVKLVPVEVGTQPATSPSIPARAPADSSALRETNQARLDALRGGTMEIDQARLDALRGGLEDTRARAVLKTFKGRREYFPVSSLARAKGFQVSQGLRDRMHDGLRALNGWGQLDHQEKVELTKRIQRTYIDYFAELISNGLTTDHIDRNQHKVRDQMRLFLMLGQARPLGESRPTSPENGKNSK